MSGIEVDGEVTAIFNDMKLRRTHKWATFKIEDKKRVVVDQEGAASATETREDDRAKFQELKDTLVQKETPRYVLYDFGFKTNTGRTVNKLAFIYW